MNIDADLLHVALVGLDLQRSAIDRKIAEIRRRIQFQETKPAPRSRPGGLHKRYPRTAKRAVGASAAPRLKPKRRTVSASKKEQTFQDFARAKTAYRDNLKVVMGFNNKAGQYELTRVEDGRVHYSFTNRQGKTTDSIMALITWQKIAARAEHS